MHTSSPPDGQSTLSQIRFTPGHTNQLLLVCSRVEASRAGSRIYWSPIHSTNKTRSHNLCCPTATLVSDLPHISHSLSTAVTAAVPVCNLPRLTPLKHPHITFHPLAFYSNQSTIIICNQHGGPRQRRQRQCRLLPASNPGRWRCRQSGHHHQQQRHSSVPGP